MQPISTESVYNDTRLGEQCDPLGILQEIQIWLFEQMVYAHIGIDPRK